MYYLYMYKCCRGCECELHVLVLYYAGYLTCTTQRQGGMCSTVSYPCMSSTVVGALGLFTRNGSRF